jgi:hypothetical protein
LAIRAFGSRRQKGRPCRWQSHRSVGDRFNGRAYVDRVDEDKVSSLSSEDDVDCRYLVSNKNREYSTSSNFSSLLMHITNGTGRLTM